MYTTQLKRKGYTTRQLALWVKQGLLPPPDPVRAGKGRGQGRHEHNWPDDTGKRAEIIKQGYQQRYDALEIAFESYLQGYVVPDVLLILKAVIRHYKRAEEATLSPKQLRRWLSYHLPNLDRQTRATLLYCQQVVTGQIASAGNQPLLYGDYPGAQYLLEEDEYTGNTDDVTQAIPEVERLLEAKRTELQLLEATLIQRAKQAGVTLTTHDIGLLALPGHRCLRGHSMLEAMRVPGLLLALYPPTSEERAAWEALGNEVLAIDAARS